MASTGSSKSDHKDTDTKETKSKKHKTTADLLVEQISKFYGIEFKDEDQFVREATKASEDRAKQKQQEDPQESAKYDEKVGQLRTLWADNDAKVTGEQKELKDRLAKEYPGAAISFKDDSWTLMVKGKEDTGHISAGMDAILASAARMDSPPES